MTPLWFGIVATLAFWILYMFTRKRSSKLQLRNFPPIYYPPGWTGDISVHHGGQLRKAYTESLQSLALAYSPWHPTLPSTLPISAILISSEQLGEANGSHERNDDGSYTITIYGDPGHPAWVAPIWWQTRLIFRALYLNLNDTQTHPGDTEYNKLLRSHL